jgi:hypothetical protein
VRKLSERGGDEFEEKICGGSPNAQQQMTMFRCDTAGRGAIQDATNKAPCLQNSVAKETVNFEKTVLNHTTPRKHSQPSPIVD